MPSIKNVRTITGVTETKGDLGVEIEVEGKRLPIYLDERYWRVDKDGSLKGESWEYVTPTPRSLSDIKEALDHLKVAYKNNLTVVSDTIRAGVHVHRNVQKLTSKQLFTFIISYFILEDVLVEWCGPSRVGNHFCLRSRDAEFVLFQLLKAIETKKLGGLNKTNIRYCSLNVCSLFKYGSIEFRAMRGTSDLDLIYTWAATIDELYNSCLKFSDPREVVLSVCSAGEAELIRTLLPTTYKNFITNPNYKEAIRDGARRVQMLAFSVDWFSFDKPSKNPFNEEENLALSNGGPPIEDDPPLEDFPDDVDEDDLNDFDEGSQETVN